MAIRSGLGLQCLKLNPVPLEQIHQFPGFYVVTAITNKPCLETGFACSLLHGLKESGLVFLELITELMRTFKRRK